MGTKRVGWARIRSLINENTNALKMTKRVVETISESKTLTESDSGTLFTTTGAAARTITLPPALTGLEYEFHFGATFTGTFAIHAASSADTFQGVISHHDKDHLGTVVALNENIDTDGWNFPAAADYRLTLDADTDGRFIGGWVKFTAVSDAIWLLQGSLFGDGTTSHIFS